MRFRTLSQDRKLRINGDTQVYMVLSIVFRSCLALPFQCFVVIIVSLMLCNDKHGSHHAILWSLRFEVGCGYETVCLDCTFKRWLNISKYRRLNVREYETLQQPISNENFNVLPDLAKFKSIWSFHFCPICAKMFSGFRTL